MKTLHHYPLCPFSRQLRLICKELEINVSLIKEEFWIRRPQFLKLNHSGEIPVLIDLSGLVICGIYPIIEYINDEYPDCRLMDSDIAKASEIRRLISWFNDKFYREVTKWIVDEKLIRLLRQAGAPRTDFIRAAKTNLVHHMKYMTNLLNEKGCLAADRITFADLAAASHLSILDFFGEIIWENYPEVKEWYSLIKSRPSFKPLLQDSIPGFFAPEHYQDLDF